MNYLIRPFILILAPIILLPLIFVHPSNLSNCAYVLILMAIYWVTEAIHLSVTSLLPIILLPLLGVIDSERVTMHYFTNTNMLFLGSLIVARGIEHCNLHKRIALFILKLFGTNPIMLILGFMLPTWFMSMWISNVAATSMGDSIAQAVIAEMEKWAQDHEPPHANDLEIKGKLEFQNISDTEKKEREILIKKNQPIVQQVGKSHFTSLATGISLSIAYAATCGGIGTLTGTGPNLILEGLIVSRYGESSGLNFGSYMAYAVPISVLCLICTWAWICLLFIGPKKIFRQNKDKSQEKKVMGMLDREYNKLGPMSFAELSSIIWLFILIVLWITRNPGYPLWNRLFVYKQTDGSSHSFATDTQPVILIAIIFLSWPAKNPFKKKYWLTKHKHESLLPWNEMQKGLSWSVIFLLGGSFALADACQVSGLSSLIGSSLHSLTTVPPMASMFLVICGICLVTGITSNTATATIVLPILLSLAECNNINPLYLALPGAVAASLAFCLPVSTPPNAIVFANGRIKIFDMIRCGLFLNVVCILIVFICTISYGQAIYGLNEFPKWANHCSTTGNKTLLH
uniref:Slc13a-1 n=1 Tax=Schmidtea mediterranea TaxID=79327 RepID=A0A0H3YEZ7_SCHMD|nr:slc13a-1 [Schmidtea mediterranea]